MKLRQRLIAKLFLFGNLALAFAKAAGNYLIFALQMTIKHLALLLSYPVENGFRIRTSYSCNPL